MNCRDHRSNGHLLRVSAAICALAGLLPTGVLAESHDTYDIAPFKLTDVSGHVRVGFIHDEQERGDGSPDFYFESRDNWEQEVFVDTRSYVYHPGFLNIELGGGPVLLQQLFDSSLGDSRTNDTLFNYRGRFNFLDLKNYPVSVYFERTHPAAYTSLAGRFLTRNNQYGIAGRVFELWNSTTLNMDLRHWDSYGSGLDSVVDEDVDTATFSVRTEYRESDYVDARFIRTDRESASGNLGLPLQRTLTSQESGEIRAVNKFGGQKQFEVNQTLRRLQQEIESNAPLYLDEHQYEALVRWRHSDKARSFMRFRTQENDRRDTSSATRMASAGFSRNEINGLAYDIGADYNDIEQTGFAREQYGARGSVSYSREMGFGSIGTSVSVGAARADQVADADSIQVFDESLVLAGTTPVDLANEFVVPGSVVVKNATQTQIYTEGLDYRLIEIGSVTSVQRLIGGAISDGETVLVDYRFTTSGTAEFDILNSGLSVNAVFLKYFDAFVRYHTQDTSVISGELTNPTNDRDSLEFGLGVRNRFLDGWGISAEYRHLDQDEEISPFVRDALNLSLSGGFRGLIGVTLSAGYANVDRERSAEDVRQTNYGLRLTTRVRRLSLAYQGSYILDKGGTLPRKQVLQRLNAQWSYRLVRIVLQAQYTQEELGLTDRNYMNVTAQVMREF